jgi:adenosyl cobinamide kinase/adenosyl cobinamide phosphate guanylyltransferase
MLDALKTLFENDVVSEEVRTSIEEAWEAKIKENKQAVTAELREEFAKKYEHDKSVMVDAVDAMISERLAEEISEFADDRKQLAEAKAKYAVAMRKNADLMQRFVVESLGKEITELHADQKAMAEKFGMLENFVVESLAKEIAEFYEDKKRSC